MGGHTKSKKKSKHDNEEEQLEERFAAAETRPHFRTPKFESNKVVLDERFSSVLSDPRFQLEEKDKYGRRTKQTKNKELDDEDNGKESKIKKNKSVSSRRIEIAKEDLKSFYVVEENRKGDDDDDTNGTSSNTDSESESASDKKTIDDDSDAEDDVKNVKKHSSSTEADDEAKILEDPESRIAYLSALSRGEIDVSSSSEDDESSESSGEDEKDDDSDDGGDPIYGKAGVLDPSTREETDDVDLSYEPSPYLVVTNMDWENIRAVDVFVIMSSFVPPGSVKGVQVYQSDFGMEQMARDKLYGPSNIWRKKTKDSKKRNSNANSEDENESEDDNDSRSYAGSHDESGKGSDESRDAIGLQIEEESTMVESDFDPEKLRAYEASKLKYYFAIVEFTESGHADIAYREVDGMEFEHSSAAVDLRTIPADTVQDVVDGRPLRDEATSVPGNYEPPDFVVSALQQTNVQCTWDQGDTERERKLTSYNNWQSMEEMDDLKAYLASDASSDENDSDHSDDEGHRKGSRMRALLGLDDSDDDGDKSDGNRQKSIFTEEDQQDEGGDGDDNDDADEEEGMSKSIKYFPGQQQLQEKIRSKLDSKEEAKELTPWEKYQEKRKQKRRERRQVGRGSKKNDSDVDFSKINQERDVSNRKNRGSSFDHDDESSTDDPKLKEKRTTEQLELLLAGEHNEELERDFNIRGIQRLEKNKDKKFTGSRKRKEAKVTSDVAGTDFKVNVQDDRFKAVLDGADDRFGIDKTDPNYKDTSAMREILSEQINRRKKKRQKMMSSDDTQKSANKAVPVDVSVDDPKKSSGANALSSLVKRMKQRL